MKDTYAKKIYAQTDKRGTRTAIQRTTASSACAVLDLLLDGRLSQSGFVRQEDIPLADFLSNRFRAVYAQ
jgi:saccharopine dehydrogenase-like NADP-dependent oxidoreductase